MTARAVIGRKPWLGPAMTGSAAAVAVFLGYVYLAAARTSTLGEALPAHFVEAGRGGLVPVEYFLISLSLVALLALALMLTGHQLCTRTRLFEPDAFEAADLGVCYFSGMALFLLLYNALGLATGRAFASLLVVLALFGAVSVHAVVSGRLWERAGAGVARHGRAMTWALPLATAGLLFLHYIVTRRWAPTYDEIARDIVVHDRIPAINRHYAQALLASAGLFLTRARADAGFVAESLAFVNHWLFISQIAMVLVLHRVLRALRVSPMAAWCGVAIVMFGNAAFSLLPHILYDHDYPLAMNIYTDSLLGLAAVLVLTLFVARAGGRDAAGDRPGPPWPSLLVPAIFMVTLNLAAELNIVVIGAILGAVILLPRARGLGRFAARPLLITAAVLAAAALVGATQGGVFSTRLTSAVRQQDSPFWERQASSAPLSIAHARWWYVPVIVPGIPMGFGNLPMASFLGPAGDVAPTDPRVLNDPVNAKFIERFRADPRPLFRYRFALYALEVRALQALHALWFPCVGIAALGAWLVSGRRPEPERAETLIVFWIGAVTAFTLASAFVFLANAENGNALSWKWALTRVLEPGLCLGMLAFVVVSDRWLAQIASARWRAFAWLSLTLLISFGTLFRIFGYPNFDGV